MKGIILAGGRATRLRPLTKITSKQLLPVYNRPMIYYPINTLISSGITDILIIVSPEYSGHFLNLLGSGKEFGAKFSYAVQEEPKGLADSFLVGEDFIDRDNVTLILGDNIFDQSFLQPISDFTSGALIFVKKVPDPQRLGVVEFDKDMRVVSIEEKPSHPKSNFASVGLYVYDNQVINIAKHLSPSQRGELEINGEPSINNTYLRQSQLKAQVIDSYWEDAGTFDSLLSANNYMAQKAKEKSK